MTCNKSILFLPSGTRMCGPNGPGAHNSARRGPAGYAAHGPGLWLQVRLQPGATDEFAGNAHALAVRKIQEHRTVLQTSQAAAEVASALEVLPGRNMRRLSGEPHEILVARQRPVEPGRGHLK